MMELRDKAIKLLKEKYNIDIMELDILAGGEVKTGQLLADIVALCSVSSSDAIKAAREIDELRFRLLRANELLIGRKKKLIKSPLNKFDNDWKKFDKWLDQTFALLDELRAMGFKGCLLGVDVKEAKECPKWESDELCLVCPVDKIKEGERR